MHAALCKVANVPPEELDEPPVKLWARDIRELSYDIEDILDCFLVRVEGHEARDPNRFKRAAKKIRKLFTKCRSMIQLVELRVGEDIVHDCRVHDMVLDLLRVKSQEENFVTIVSAQDNEGISSPSRVRRLAHQNRMLAQAHQDAQANLPHVRTFIATNCRSDDMLSFTSFQLLRVLALEDRSGGVRICLENVQNLLHLRYLGLRVSNCELPEGLGPLKFLQTLYLEFTPVKELPSSLGMLTQLICLHVLNSPAGGVIVPNGVIEKLTSLEYLHIEVQKDTIGQFVKDLGKLHELRVVEIHFWMGILRKVADKSMESDLVESLGNRCKIRHLRLEGHCAQSQIKLSGMQQCSHNCFDIWM
ncbi:hypothetical protein PR202_ga22774 [Eleusine coracana subsp. coracana]|uniref:Rx N-terminal domain-containing protein n=1 Tax=Eleusine coracana subsp. coracana TaxID=191504 RepID=A0AAV5D4E4_ELECO|nr:hypothetical protein PR202_ga22774 [Eleusine coracana subsp. coracana]